MQRGSIQRHGDGWRGTWRETGQKRVTRTCRTRTEANRLLTSELRRLEAGDQYRAPITFRQLGDRFLAAHQGQASTRAKLAHNLKRLNTILGDLEASDVTAEEVERWLNRQEYAPTYRWALVTVLRQTFNWGIRAKLVSENPAKLISAAKPKRGLNQSPFESWDEVERVADEAGKWGPLVILLVDTGARPGEIFALEHRHVDIAKGVAFLPGSKTAKSRRAVHLTPRGIAAYQAVPRTLRSPYVFNHDGEMVSRKWWWQNVWVPAVKTAGLDARPIYSTRHTFAFFSLMAGVPIADLGVEMGHENVQITSETYGHWSTEMGSRAASLRAAWASATIVEPDTGETKL